MLKAIPAPAFSGKNGCYIHLIHYKCEYAAWDGKKCCGLSVRSQVLFQASALKMVDRNFINGVLCLLKNKGKQHLKAV